jgi:hypothetical protein
LHDASWPHAVSCEEHVCFPHVQQGAKDAAGSHVRMLSVGGHPASDTAALSLEGALALWGVSSAASCKPTRVVASSGTRPSVPPSPVLAFADDESMDPPQPMAMPSVTMLAIEAAPSRRRFDHTSPRRGALRACETPGIARTVQPDRTGRNARSLLTPRPWSIASRRGVSSLASSGDVRLLILAARFPL